MKKTIAILAVLLLACTFVFASGEAETSAAAAAPAVTAEDLKAANIELQFWHAQSKANGKAMDAMVENFNQTNPYGIKVTASYQGGYGDTHTKAKAALAAGNYPNVVQTYNNNMMEYMPSGKLMNLTPYFEDEFGISQEELAQVFPSYYGENHAFADGNSYAVSCGKSVEAFFYNKTFFDANGLKVPTTLDELTEVAKQASEILGKPAFGLDSTDNWGIYGPQNFGAEYADVNGNIFIYDENNIDKTKAFYEWWENGVDNGWFRTAGEDKHCSGPFSSGKLVMFIGSISGAEYVNPDGFECAVAGNPVGPNPTVIQQGGNFCGFSTGDPLVDLATSIFLEYLYSAKAGAIYCSMTGYVPANKLALEDPIYKAVAEGTDINAQCKQVFAAYNPDWFAYDPVFKNSYKVRQALSNPVKGIELTTDSIDALIEEAKAEIEKLR